MLWHVLLLSFAWFDLFFSGWLFHPAAHGAVTDSVSLMNSLALCEYLQFCRQAALLQTDGISQSVAGTKDGDADPHASRAHTPDLLPVFPNSFSRDCPHPKSLLYIVFLFTPKKIPQIYCIF